MAAPNPEVVNWALTGTASVLTVGRFGLRGYISRRLYGDDAVHLFALVILIAHGFTNRTTDDAKADLVVLSAPKLRTSEADLVAQYQRVQRLNTVNNCFLHLVFWTVKFAFLLFYYQIFKISPNFKRVWWAVLAFTFATFWVPIGGVIATCYNLNTVAEFKSCNAAPESRAIKLKYSCAVNVASDAAIMALPLWMIKDLKISRAQKAGLAFVFSLALVCMILDIVRTIQALGSNQALYTVLEINFAVIVSCLPTYRSLLNMGQQRHTSRTYGRASKYGQFSKGSWKHISVPGVNKSKSDNSDTTQLTPDTIYVTQDYKVTSGKRDPYELETMEKPRMEFERPALPISSATSQAAIPPVHSNMV